MMLTLTLRREHRLVIGPHGWFKREFEWNLGLAKLALYLPGEGPDL